MVEESKDVTAGLMTGGIEVAFLTITNTAIVININNKLKLSNLELSKSFLGFCGLVNAAVIADDDDAIGINSRSKKN